MVRAASAHRNAQGEWVIPQIYFAYHGHGKVISRKKLLEKVEQNTHLQRLIALDPRIGALVEEAKRERCIVGYEANGRFYDYYKPRLSRLVGWERRGTPELSTMAAYDTVYEAIYELLPGDEWDIYPDGIMPNGMYCPSWQEKYGREYP